MNYQSSFLNVCECFGVNVESEHSSGVAQVNSQLYLTALELQDILMSGSDRPTIDCSCKGKRLD